MNLQTFRELMTQRGFYVAKSIFAWKLRSAVASTLYRG
jgi:hypothetical protein